MRNAPLNPDNHHVDEKNKVVYWRGSYPFVMAIPSLMETYYPDYEKKIVSWEFLAGLKELSK
jgi:hypothetical protein